RQACPLCNCERATKVRSEKDGTLVRCGECSFLYVAPRPTEEELRLIYDEEYFDGHNLGACLDFRRPVFQQCLKRLAQVCPPKGRLLDVGCGTGEFVQDALADGWQAEGIESSRPAAEFARDQKHLPVRHGVLEQANWPAESFSVVTFLDVLEHLRDPREEML